MPATQFVHESVLRGGLEPGEQVLAVGMAEVFSYKTRRLLGGLQGTEGASLQPRWIALTTHRLLELDGSQRGGFARVAGIAELRWSAMHEAIVGQMGDRRGFDVGGPTVTYGFRFFTSHARHEIDAASQRDFFERASSIVDERVRAARAAGPVSGSPNMSVVSATPIVEPGYETAVAEEARQGQASRTPVMLARGVAAILGAVGLVFLVIKLDRIGSGSFFRSACIGLFCLGLAAAAGLWSVLRDRRAAAAQGSGGR